MDSPEQYFTVKYCMFSFLEECNLLIRLLASQLSYAWYLFSRPPHSHTLSRFPMILVNTYSWLAHLRMDKNMLLIVGIHCNKLYFRYSLCHMFHFMSLLPDASQNP